VKLLDSLIAIVISFLCFFENKRRPQAEKDEIFVRPKNRRFFMRNPLEILDYGCKKFTGRKSLKSRFADYRAQRTGRKPRECVNVGFDSFY
jgi:hypothetical protein